MNFRTLAVVFFLALSGASWAQEQAFTNRSTELKDRGAAEAQTLGTLPENTAVKVLARGGGWTQIEAGAQKGWVRVFHLRFPATVEGSSASSGNPLSGISSALGFGRKTSQQTTIATTGVRGLSPEDVKNASPDTAAFAKLQSYRADKATAERFARDAKLAAVSVDYLDEAPAAPTKGRR
jgi:SH3 domain-containing protein